MTFKKQLEMLGACEDAIQWVSSKTKQEAWEQCERGDWMLWLYKKLYPDNLREITLAKAYCANTVRHLMKDERSLKAVDNAILFGLGKLQLKDLVNSKNAADAAAADAYAAAAADAAAYAAAYAAAADAARSNFWIEASEKLIELCNGN